MEGCNPVESGLVSFWQQVLYGILQVSCQPHWRDPDILQVLQCEQAQQELIFQVTLYFGIIFLLGIVFKLSPNTFITFALNPVKEFIDFSLQNCYSNVIWGILHSLVQTQIW